MKTEINEINGYGISISLPSGWNAKLFRNNGILPEVTEAVNFSPPTLHVANFSLPAVDGNFGTEAAQSMSVGDSLIVLMEYIPDENLVVGEGLFEPEGLPSDIEIADFDPASMPEMIQGLAGVQYFFSTNGRAFCLFLRIGGYEDVVAAQKKGDETQLDLIRWIVDSLEISPVSATGGEGRGPRYETTDAGNPSRAEG